MVHDKFISHEFVISEWLIFICNVIGGVVSCVHFIFTQ